MRLVFDGLEKAIEIQAGRPVVFTGRKSGFLQQVNPGDGNTRGKICD